MLWGVYYVGNGFGGLQLITLFNFIYPQNILSIGTDMYLFI